MTKSAGDYVQASLRRLEMITAVEDALREVDVLLCASSMDPPSRIEDAAETERTYRRQARTPFNVTGHPALAMMAGLSSRGLPLSVQFVGRNFARPPCSGSPAHGSVPPAPTRSTRRSADCPCDGVGTRNLAIRASLGAGMVESHLSALQAAAKATRLRSPIDNVRVPIRAAIFAVAPKCAGRSLPNNGLNVRRNEIAQHHLAAMVDLAGRAAAEPAVRNDHHPGRRGLAPACQNRPKTT